MSRLRSNRHVSRSGLKKYRKTTGGLITVDVVPGIAADYTDAAFAEDCPNVPFVPTVVDPAPRIIAIGDIHGDLTLAKESFKLAKLIDDNLNWIAKPPNTIVVQVGDQIDSCRDSCRTKKSAAEDKAEDISVLDFFDSMHVKARAKGGAVYSLIGNHELMNANHNFSNVSYANLEMFHYQDMLANKTYTGIEGRKKAFQPGGPIAKRIACSRPSVLIVGSIFFIHAGVLPTMATALDASTADIRSKMVLLNKIVRKWLLNSLSNTDPKEMRKIQLMINDTNGPFWTRTYGHIKRDTPMTDSACREVKEFLEVYKIGHIVVGHTPQITTDKPGINSTCYEIDEKTGRLHKVDGGFSTSFDRFRNDRNTIQVLEILYNRSDKNSPYSFKVVTGSRPNPSG